MRYWGSQKSKTTMNHPNPLVLFIHPRGTGLCPLMQNHVVFAFRKWLLFEWCRGCGSFFFAMPEATTTSTSLSDRDATTHERYAKCARFVITELITRYDLRILALEISRRMCDHDITARCEDDFCFVVQLMCTQCALEELSWGVV